MRMQGTDRRQQLIETALDVFSRKGFDGATTKEIAAAAGVTEAVIFRHFPTKQALYSAVVQARSDSGEMEKWLADMKSLTDKNDDEGLFREIARSILQCYREDPRHERTMLYAALEGQQQMLIEHRRFSLPIKQLLVEYVSRRQKEGALRPGPPIAVIMAIVGMAAHHGMMTSFFGFDLQIADEEAIDSFVRILMNGVGVNKSKKGIRK